MVDLQALVYVSSAVVPLDDAQVQRLLERARQRNAREHVTGVLLYSDGAFMQYLEGPSAGLATVYAAICSDPQHHGIIEILREPIVARQFDAWSMAFRSTEGFEAAAPADDGLAQLLNPDSGGDMSGARLLLSKFWQRASDNRWR